MDTMLEDVLNLIEVPEAGALAARTRTAEAMRAAVDEVEAEMEAARARLASAATDEEREAAEEHLGGLRITRDLRAKLAAIAAVRVERAREDLAAA